MRVLFTLLICLLSLHQPFADGQLTYKKPHDLLGIGAAEIDMITFVDDEYIKRNLSVPYGITKGEVAIIDRKTFETIREQIENFSLSPSGEVASTLYSFASLGGDAAFNSSISSDEYGVLIEENMRDLGIDMINHTGSGDMDTLVNLVFVTKDGERTVVSRAESKPTITQTDVKYHLIKDYKAVIAEAFSWDAGQASKAIMRAFNAASKVGAQRVFMLSDVRYAKKHRLEFLEILDRVDILFATEAEIKALTRAKTLDEAIGEVSHIVKVLVVTRGKKGSIIVADGKRIKVTTLLEDDKVVNTSGAGSAFAAGFLYGYLNGKTAEESGKLASKVAEYMIQQVESKPKKGMAALLQ